MELIENVKGTAIPELVSRYGANGTDVNIYKSEEVDEYGTKLYIYDIYRFENETFENNIVALIRTRYSVSEELAILRQKETKPEEYQAYFDFVEECKGKGRL